MTQQTFIVDYGLTINGTDGNINLPSGNPSIQTPDQTGTITLKVQGGATERSLIELGSDGGNDQFVYISTQNNTGNRATIDMGAYAGNPAYAQIQTYDGVSVSQSWLFTTAPLDSTEALFYVPGGAAIVTPNATGGGAGKNIFIEAGAADQSDFYTTAGGELFLKGGRGAFNDGGGGGPGGAVNINAGESSDPAGVAGNVYITAGALKQWVFDNTGKLTMPGPAQLAVYADTTARDAAITSPAPGMMCYVTGTGMQVRGATSWNTIAGSGT